ncbi:hypothetical protein K7395_09155 [Streptomyces filamentosus]|uniref:Uncharacterized protein n=1 Tax=Streptomyces filamentosus TaxID=67294 RepID=A0ABY4USZ9_STRFL|nr:hypothetical protein [Streptomyces filamentosus]USC46892.1 hypothetical protein K7395_09155 [Streptomyces filamentosus]
MAPGTAPEGAGCREPVPGPPPARTSAGPGWAASRRQVAATTGRDEPPPVATEGPENPSPEPVLMLRGRSGSRVRARRPLGESVDVFVGAVPPEPCAVAVRSRGMGRIRTGGGGVVVTAERWTGAGAGPDGSAGPLATAGADLTGIAAGALGGVAAGAGTVGPEPGVAAGPGPGTRSAFGRVTADGRSPSSGAPPPSRAVGGSEGSGAPIPPRTRAEVFGPGAGARCTEGEGSDGFDDG